MDNRLLQQFYEQYSKELYIYLYTLCNNRQLSEDLLQETFLKAILSLPDKHTNVRAWLYMVARNLYFNHYKREKPNAAAEISDKTAEIAPDTLENLIEDENKRILYKALESLSPTKKEILRLQYFGRLSHKQIAAILHLSPENVRVLGCRGKKELKKYLEVNGYEV